MSEQKLYRILLAVFVVLIAALLIPALIIFADGNRLYRTYWRADAAYRDDDYESAISALEYCVARRPHDTDGWWNLAIARFRAGDFAGTAAAFECSRAVQANPPRDWHLVAYSYVRALSEGRMPIGPLPTWLRRRSSVPREYYNACSELQSCRYADAAALFEGCRGQMPGLPGEDDVLWGVAIARFHDGDLGGSIEALGEIAARWEGKESDEFKAVVGYMQRCTPGEEFPLGMPLVLRRYATYQEGRRQQGIEGD